MDYNPKGRTGRYEYFQNDPNSRRPRSRGWTPLVCYDLQSYQRMTDCLKPSEKKKMETTTTNQISETAKQKLEANSELWKEQSDYVKLEDGEKRVLRFDPEKIKHVEGQYGTRIQYAVIDPNYPDKEKKFEQGKTTSKEIDKYLAQGHLLLKVQRIGAGKDTKYVVQPAD